MGGAFPHVASDGGLSLAVLQGFGPSSVGYYQLLLLGSWLLLHNPDVASL